MGLELEDALKRLPPSANRVGGATDARLEREARDAVLAVLDAGLRDPRPDAVEMAQLGSMLLVRHPGAPDRSWIATAHALRRIAAAVGLETGGQDHGGRMTPL